MASAAWGPGFRFVQNGIRQLRSSNKRNVRSFASSSGVASQSSAGSFLGSAVVRAGLISGSLSLAGDLVAQLLVNWGKDSATYDAARAARMGSFGLFLYGPYQHYWYSALDRAMPARTAANFALKVTMNQLLLAPLVVGGIFAWNLALQGRLGEWAGKTKADFVPTIVTGWKFWVPAATINFVAVPLRSQVLYMSCCGLVWTAFLSASSAEKDAPAAAPAKGKRR